MKNTQKKIVFAFLVLFMVTSTVFADAVKDITAIINSTPQEKVNFGVNIIDARNGSRVFSFFRDRSMMPASNMKVITGASALKYLGKDYEYITKVGLCGDDLVIIGSGDPLLGDAETDLKYGRKAGWIFEDVAAKLNASDVNDINNIIIDTTVFDDNRVHSAWPAKDLNKWWACEICGLNYNNNCIEMTVKNKSGKAVVEVQPQTRYIRYNNQVRIIKTGTGAVGAYRVPGRENYLQVKGKVRKMQGPFEVAIERPAAMFGHLLAEKISEHSVTINGSLIEKSFLKHRDFKLIAEYRTSFADCLARCNKDSLGMVAESFVKTIGAKTNGGYNGSWENGAEAIKSYLNSLGITSDQYVIDDGSGLSRNNKLSAEAITTVLYNVYKSQDWEFYKKSLAVGGSDGTIAQYFKEEKYKGKIFGKTGYIDGVKSLSGVCYTENGVYIFSILTNQANGNTRTAINNIVKALFE